MGVAGLLPLPTSGGSRDMCGMALFEVKLGRPRKSDPTADPMGDPTDGMRDSVSARSEGVPTTVLASPKRTSISSRRTPQVSG